MGNYIKKIRESLQEKFSGFSGREVAKRMGMHYSYLSKFERGDYAPMTEKLIHALVRELGESPDLLMVLGGKVSTSIACLIRNIHPFVGIGAGRPDTNINHWRCNLDTYFRYNAYA